MVVVCAAPNPIWACIQHRKLIEVAFADTFFFLAIAVGIGLSSDGDRHSSWVVFYDHIGGGRTSIGVRYCDLVGACAQVVAVLGRSTVGPEVGIRSLAIGCGNMGCPIAPCIIALA